MMIYVLNISQDYSQSKLVAIHWQNIFFRNIVNSAHCSGSLKKQGGNSLIYIRGVKTYFCTYTQQHANATSIQTATHLGS